jgi:hypothetical protein
MAASLLLDLIKRGLCSRAIFNRQDLRKNADKPLTDGAARKWLQQIFNCNFQMEFFSFSKLFFPHLLEISSSF